MDGGGAEEEYDYDGEGKAGTSHESIHTRPSSVDNTDEELVEEVDGSEDTYGAEAVEESARLEEQAVGSLACENDRENDTEATTTSIVMYAATSAEGVSDTIAETSAEGARTVSHRSEHCSRVRVSVNGTLTDDDVENTSDTSSNTSSHRSSKGSFEIPQRSVLSSLTQSAQEAQIAQATADLSADNSLLYPNIANIGQSIDTAATGIASAESPRGPRGVLKKLKTVRFDYSQLPTYIDRDIAQSDIAAINAINNRRMSASAPRKYGSRSRGNDRNGSWNARSDGSRYSRSSQGHHSCSSYQYTDEHSEESSDDSDSEDGALARRIMGRQSVTGSTLRGRGDRRKKQTEQYRSSPRASMVNGRIAAVHMNNPYNVNASEAINTTDTTSSSGDYTMENKANKRRSSWLDKSAWSTNNTDSIETDCTNNAGNNPNISNIVNGGNDGYCDNEDNSDIDEGKDADMGITAQRSTGNTAEVTPSTVESANPISLTMVTSNKSLSAGNDGGVRRDNDQEYRIENKGNSGVSEDKGGRSASDWEASFSSFFSRLEGIKTTSAPISATTSNASWNTDPLCASTVISTDRNTPSSTNGTSQVEKKGRSTAIKTPCKKAGHEETVVKEAAKADKGQNNASVSTGTSLPAATNTSSKATYPGNKSVTTGINGNANANAGATRTRKANPFSQLIATSEELDSISTARSSTITMGGSNGKGMSLEQKLRSVDALLSSSVITSHTGKTSAKALDSDRENPHTTASAIAKGAGDSAGNANSSTRGGTAGSNRGNRNNNTSSKPTKSIAFAALNSNNSNSTSNSSINSHRPTHTSTGAAGKKTGRSATGTSSAGGGGVHKTEGKLSRDKVVSATGSAGGSKRTSYHAYKASMSNGSSTSENDASLANAAAGSRSNAKIEDSSGTTGSGVSSAWSSGANPFALLTRTKD